MYIVIERMSGAIIKVYGPIAEPSYIEGLVIQLRDKRFEEIGVKAYSIEYIMYAISDHPIDD